MSDVPNDFVVMDGDCSVEEVRRNHAKALVMALNAVGKLGPGLEALQESMCRKFEGLGRSVEKLLDTITREHDRIMEDRGRLEQTIRDLNALGTKLREHEEKHAEAERDQRDTRKQIGLIFLQYVLPIVMFLLGGGMLVFSQFGTP